MAINRDQMVEQIDAALRHYLNLRNNLAAEDQRRANQTTMRRSYPVDPVFWTEVAAFGAAAVSAIENATRRDSAYSEQARHCVADIESAPKTSNPARLTSTHRLKGILDQVRSALMSGYLMSYEELVHGEVFGDFLEMASQLLEFGYKDAAAVIAGTALEVHLRDLCKKYNISLTTMKDDKDKQKQAATLNDDLMKANVYSSLEHKQIIAWQGLRNDAAHGDYTRYDVQQVALLIQGVRDFIVRNPA